MFTKKDKKIPCPACGYKNLTTEIRCKHCNISLLRAEREAERLKKASFQTTKWIHSPLKWLASLASWAIVVAFFYIIYIGPILLILVLSYYFYPTASPWVALFWLHLCLTASNQTPRAEIFSILHSLVALYVVFALFIGTWEPMGRWERLGISSPLNGTLVLGWVLWFVSFIFGVITIRDYQYRFDPYSDASYFSRHRQIGYVVAFLGVCLIAYSSGTSAIPFYISIGFLFITIGSLE